MVQLNKIINFLQDQRKKGTSAAYQVYSTIGLHYLLPVNSKPKKITIGNYMLFSVI